MEGIAKNDKILCGDHRFNPIYNWFGGIALCIIFATSHTDRLEVFAFNYIEQAEKLLLSILVLILLKADVI